MKAVQIKEFGGSDVLETVSLSEPKITQPKEVKVKLYATGLNPNESYTITGTYGAFQPELPYVPGFDGAGVIEEIGTAVEKFNVGDRVWLSGFLAESNTGTYAEKVVIAENYVYPLPENLSMMAGAGLGIPVLTAYRALFQRAHLKEKETVLIHGASGAVGSLAVQMAKANGAKVIGTASTAAGRAKIIALGADYALNHLTAKNKQELLQVTDNKGPDVIIEMLANANLEIDMEVIAEKGRIVVVGNRGSIEITPRHLMGTEAIITAVNVGRMSQSAKEEAIQGIQEFLTNGSVVPLIGREFTLDEPKAAHQEMMAGASGGRTIFAIAKE